MRKMHTIIKNYTNTKEQITQTRPKYTVYNRLNNVYK